MVHLRTQMAHLRTSAGRPVCRGEFGTSRRRRPEKRKAMARANKGGRLAHIRLSGTASEPFQGHLMAMKSRSESPVSLTVPERLPIMNRPIREQTSVPDQDD